MADPATIANHKVSRGQAILIGVLASVLAAVLFFQFRPAPGDADTAPTGYVPRRVPVVPAAANTDAVAGPGRADANPRNNQVTAATFVDASKWKSPNLEDVVDYDPFALPELFPKSLAEEAVVNSDDLVAAAKAEDARKLAEAILQVEADLKELQQVGVQVIVRQGNQYVAMIGDRTVHVGEEIKGFTVTKIDPTNGVVVERKSVE